MRITLLAMLAMALASVAAPAAAEPKFPELTGRVVDTADELPPADEARLTIELEAFEKRTGHQLVVVTVPDLEGVDKADYAIALGRKWGIGRKGADDGILMLRSPGDGKPGSGRTFIAVGYGLESVLTDADTFHVYNDIMKPILVGETGTDIDNLPKPQRAAPAIMAGAKELMRIAAITPEQKAADARREATERAQAWASFKDGVLTLFGWLIGLGITGGTGYGIWWMATAKKRAEARRLAAEREAERQRQYAEQRRLQEIEDRRRAEAERQRIAEARRAREAMLAAMTPAARQAFLDGERRKAETAAERRRIEEERAAAERKRRREREEIEERAAKKRRDEDEERNRRTSSGGIGGGGIDGGGIGGGGLGGGGDSFSGGGGSFGGGGAGGND